MYLEGLLPYVELRDIFNPQLESFKLSNDDDFSWALEDLSMSNGIRDVFDDMCVNTQISTRFIKDLHSYRANFAAKNEDHIAFFGGNLLGVQTVRFTTSDINHWFSYIIEVDDIELEQRLHDLPTVNGDFKVASNVFNLSCIWLCHAIFRAPGLSQQVKHEAMVDVLLVLQYKFITSLLFRYFPYAADRNLAEAAYSELSLKFDIKRYGSWGALLRARAENVLSSSSIHRKTIERMDQDNKVMYVLTDMQGRIRDMMKNICEVMNRMQKSGSTISSTTSISTIEGEEILRDKANAFNEYTRYINQIISDRNSFIKADLVEVIKRMMPTMQPRLFMTSLEWFSDNYHLAMVKELEAYLTNVLVHSFEYLCEHKSNLRGNIDLPGLLTRLRGVYMASRSTETRLMELREVTEDYVSLATRNRNPNIVSAIRTGVLLYIVARAITRHHYSSVRAV